ncbi:serine hydrolase domain-containing protein [Bernardetia sp. ABR2-2B]|uniref:serine hydrolase domain-containing protein n=1 Tax=Bernardetia sp. ABR2-2B TaxID=3127472 RepID=UPI0030CE99EC
MKNNNITYFLLTLILLITGCKNDKPTTKESIQEIKDDYSARIDSLILTTSPRKFNGVVFITKNGETKYEKAYGYSDFDKKTPISSNDNFRIQSNSKQITAVLVLKEVEKGNINLESTIKIYLPNLEQTWADTVTVHQLLNMSSGIIDVNEPLLFEAGKGYRYSNPGYGLLGNILEHVTKKEYSELANSLFEELKMTNTYCYQPDGDNKGLVNSYWLESNEVSLVAFDSIGFTKESWKSFIPAGGIISNVSDLNLWDTKLHKGKVLSTDFYNKMTIPTNKGTHAAFDNDTLGYAYGLRVHDQHPIKHLGHGGRGIGFVCIKFYIPENDIDVIVWENIYCLDNDIEPLVVYHFENEIRKIVLSSSLVE